MAGTPNGTAATAAGCKPYFPEVAYGNDSTAGNFVCLPSVQPGVVSTDGSVCLNAGFVGRPSVVSGQSTFVCADPGSALAGDVVWATDAGKSACAAQGMTTSGSGSTLTCTGTRATVVNDAGASSRLDALGTKVDAFAKANHQDLQAVAAATPTPAPATTAGTVASAPDGVSQAGSFEVQPLMVALFSPVVIALCAIVLWSFWRRVTR